MPHGHDGRVTRERMADDLVRAIDREMPVERLGGDADATVHVDEERIHAAVPCRGVDVVDSGEHPTSGREFGEPRQVGFERLTPVTFDDG